ncbi:MAG: sigma-70 family RNA polymerase sigma factor [Bacillota bacterium]|nr:sigma-70 family RNA polymerase sigma factor [Bacillota bacterium]
MSFIPDRQVNDLEYMYDKYGNMLFRLCLVILSNKSDAEDAIQETFLKYIKKQPVFNMPEHEKAWFIRVASNVCKDIQRFKFRHKEFNIEELADYQSDIEHSYILEQLLSLPPKYKVVIHLYYVEGYKVDEIAKITELSSSAVKMRLSRGRELLRIELEEEHDL